MTKHSPISSSACSCGKSYRPIAGAFRKLSDHIVREEQKAQAAKAAALPAAARGCLNCETGLRVPHSHGAAS